MSAAVRAPGVLSCLFTLLCMDVMPRLVGLRRTFDLLRRVTVRTYEPTNSAEIIDQATHRVAVAAAFYPRRALCLEQSLTLFFLLRRRGVPAELRMGVQPRPFLAHAWVEVGGRPLNEREDLPLTLAPFPGLGV